MCGVSSWITSSARSCRMRSLIDLQFLTSIKNYEQRHWRTNPNHTSMRKITVAQSFFRCCDDDDAFKRKLCTPVRTFFLPSFFLFVSLIPRSFRSLPSLVLLMNVFSTFNVELNIVSHRTVGAHTSCWVSVARKLLNRIRSKFSWRL